MAWPPPRRRCAAAACLPPPPARRRVCARQQAAAGAALQSRSGGSPDVQQLVAATGHRPTACLCLPAAPAPASAAGDVHGGHRPAPAQAHWRRQRRRRAPAHQPGRGHDGCAACRCRPARAVGAADVDLRTLPFPPPSHLPSFQTDPCCCCCRPPSPPHTHACRRRLHQRGPGVAPGGARGAGAHEDQGCVRGAGGAVPVQPVGRGQQDQRAPQGGACWVQGGMRGGGDAAGLAGGWRRAAAWTCVRASATVVHPGALHSTH